MDDAVVPRQVFGTADRIPSPLRLEESQDAAGDAGGKFDQQPATGHQATMGLGDQRPGSIRPLTRKEVGDLYQAVGL